MYLRMFASPLIRVWVRGDTISSASLPTSFQMSVSLTWAWVLDTSDTGRKEARAGGREVTEEWVWQEVCTLSPAPASRRHTPCSEWAG